MSFERTKAGFCALFLLAGCGQTSLNDRRLTDREWNDIHSLGWSMYQAQSKRDSSSKCDKVKVVGSPGYYTCGGDQKLEPYYGHLFDY